MKRRNALLIAIPILAVGCGGGTPTPPALAYGGAGDQDLTYLRADTSMISLSMMGQSMDVSQRGEMTLQVGMSRTSAGTDVTMSVTSLQASIAQPMGGPIRVDESAVEGSLMFTLDRRGGATVNALPDVDLEAAQLFSGLSMAHTFFPRLPGRAFDIGGSWVDTLTFEGDDGAGYRSETSITTYTVEGEDTFDGRPVLRIGLTGSSTLMNEFEMGGMALSQESDVEYNGHVLWDLRNGVMVEHVRTATGSGEVNVPIAPVPLPIEVEVKQVSRLGGM